MTIDRATLIALAVAALGFGAYRAGFAADSAADKAARLTVNHVVSGGAAGGVSYLWVVDEVHRRVAICTARAAEAPACNANAATLP